MSADPNLQYHPPTESLPLVDGSALKLKRLVREVLGKRLVYQALYPKHIFIHKQKPMQEIAVIDLEKARLTSCGWYRTYFDLAALFRHTSWWS